jgi:hypothetical protein
MAYYRSHTGGSLTNNVVSKGTTGAATAASMPNFGTSIVANTSAEAWVLQAPVQGCRKRVIFTGLTSANTNILRSCTTGGDDISFAGATTGINTLSISTMSGAFPLVVDLEGASSILWYVTNVFPQTTVIILVPTSA